MKILKRGIHINSSTILGPIVCPVCCTVFGNICYGHVGCDSWL